MTYLQLVNAVLRRLRENEVTTLQSLTRQNSYAKLIGDFVNEAKAQVENAWDWSALRTTLTATTSQAVFSYDLTGCDNRTKIIDVINDTDDHVLQYRDTGWFNRAFLTATPEQGSPSYYNPNGLSSVGDLLVDIYPVPDKAYDIRFNVVKRQADLAADSDVLLVPSRPVILLATAMAIEERGEDGGQQSVNAYAVGQSALSDEISFDAARHIEDTIWYEA
jgi:hypothetical protein